MTELSKLGVHDHLCLLYETQEEQFAAVIPFIRLGLEKNYKCLYIVDENTAAAIQEQFVDEGIDVEAVLGSRQLEILTKKDSYLKEGYFDPDNMIEMLRKSTVEAKAAGFAGLRVTGEMTWALGKETGVSRLTEYEAKLNSFLPHNDALAICQYNLRRFSADVIKRIIQTHPLVIYQDMIVENFYYVPPNEFLSPGSEQMEVSRLLQNLVERKLIEQELAGHRLNLEALVDERTRELKAAQETAETANRLKSQFLDIAAHELRTPVTALSVLLQFAEMQYKKGHPVDDLTLARIRAQTSRISRLVVDLLDVSRLERGVVVLKREPVDLVSLIFECINNYKLQMPERRFTLLESQKMITADIDPLRIFQVVSNLIDNATRYAPEKTPIEVTVEAKPNTVRVSVRDFGPGISNKQQELLFRPFSSVDNSGRPTGLGLGLYISRNLIELHGGTIGVTSKLGSGSTFYFELPRKVS